LHFNNDGKIKVNEDSRLISYNSEKSNVFIHFIDDVNMEKINTKISRVYNKIEQNTTVKTTFSDNKNCYRTFVVDINDKTIHS
ncbi:hypothetical protein, partial [Vallitalea sediminicola]